MNITDICKLTGLYCNVTILQKIAFCLDSSSLMTNNDFAVLHFKFNSMIYLFSKFAYNPAMLILLIMILMILGCY